MTSFSAPSLGFGLGLRAPHYDEVMRDQPAVDWFEIISENYIAAHKGYRDYLTDLRRTYPLVMHGVSLSIGSTDPIDQTYLHHLKNLADTIEAAWVSDHLCFTSLDGVNTHDLLPIPYTEEALAHLIPRIHHAQEALQRPLVFENASSYLQFNGATLSESAFLRELCARTGCGILLDINNVIVSSFNHGWDAKVYVDDIPAASIAQYHLAGHVHKGSYLIDTHDSAVTEETWNLYAYALQTKGFRSTLIEWDSNIPPLSTLMDELEKARAVASAAMTRAA